MASTSASSRLRIALREPRASHIHFVVRDDASRSDILFQTELDPGGWTGIVT